jgi:predicted GIY-YIG superfamily endonuclease
VYIVSSRSRNIYTGVTNDLQRRISQHKQGFVQGFTKRYRIHRLVYYEEFGDIRAAIARENEGQALGPKKTPCANCHAKPDLERSSGVPVSERVISSRARLLSGASQLSLSSRGPICGPRDLQLQWIQPKKLRIPRSSAETTETHKSAKDDLVMTDTQPSARERRERRRQSFLWRWRGADDQSQRAGACACFRQADSLPASPAPAIWRRARETGRGGFF